MTARELWTLEHGDTGAALLFAKPAGSAVSGAGAYPEPCCPHDRTHHVGTMGCCTALVVDADGYGANCECRGSTPVEADKVNGSSASVYSDRDKSEKPMAEPTRPAVDPRVKRLVALSRWERAGMLAYIAATFPDAFDEAYDALGLGEQS